MELADHISDKIAQPREAQLTASELQFALKAARVGTWRLDLTSEELTTSTTCKLNFGRNPDEPFTYAELRDAVHSGDKDRMVAAVQRSIGTGEDYDIEYRLLTPDNEVRWVQIRAQPAYAADGTPVALAGVSIDITDRHRAESALRESEQRYQDLFNRIDEGFSVIEMLDGPDGPLSDYVHLEANAAFVPNAGLPESVGKRCRELIPRDEADVWVDIYRRVLVSGESTRFERELVETGRHLEVAAFRVEPASRRQVAILFKDVTARKRAEIALNELNETLEQRVEERSAAVRLYESIVNSDAAPVVAFDHDFRVTAFNPAHARYFRQVYGMDARVGDILPDLFVPEQAGIVRGFMARALAGETFTVREPFGDPAIEKIYWEISYNPIREDDGRVIGAFHHAVDITAQHKAEAELAHAQEALRQSQKMEAMGQLTGGVAHDFNNLLTPIVGALDLLGRKGLGGEREQRLIAGASQSAERARTLVQRLLAFARRQPLKPVAVDLTELVEGMRDLIASTIGPQIKLSIDLPDTLPASETDPNQLEMALLNLAVNARDAMPDGGELTITAAATSVEGDPSLKPGEYVRLSVGDTGTGMDATTLEHAIEPFFSTKGIGKGTGLGLSMVHGLATQLGGTLRIDSDVGRGTTIHLWLPRSSATPVLPSVPQSVDCETDCGVALLVDDEDLVRASTADMLAEVGYQVIEVASALEALDLLRLETVIDVVVTDHLMPGMNGTELARLAREARSNLPVLIVSGYAELEGIAPELPRLAKPFRKDELAAALGVIISSER